MNKLPNIAGGEQVKTTAHPSTVAMMTRIRSRLEQVDREQDERVAALLERTRRKVSAALSADSPVAPVWIAVDNIASPSRRSILTGLADLRNAGERRKRNQKKTA
jgi:hypothetical protein